MKPKKTNFPCAINERPLVSEANNQSVPPTMDLDENEVSDFVFPKRKRDRKRSDQVRRSNKKRSNNPRPPPASSSSLHQQLPNPRQLILTGLPLDTTEKQLYCTYAKFGRIVRATMMTNRSASILFSDTTSLNRARKEAFNSAVKENQRRPSIMSTHSSSSGSSNSNSSSSSNSNDKNEEEEEEVQVRQIFRYFNWKISAARYIFRMILMEDYLAYYIDALASYRELEEESLESLTKLLIELSDSCPNKELHDINLMMPPNVSGLVYNQTTFRQPDKKYFDVQRILKRNEELFRITRDKKVKYLHRVRKSEAVGILRNILVEGLFLYFLAKFCHGAEFAIKISYYERSEPIRSSLIYATGSRKMSTAIRAYFDCYSEIFSLSEDLSLLRMTSDYFDKDFRNDLRNYLRQVEDDVFDMSGVIVQVSDDDGGVVVTFSHESSFAFYEKVIDPFMKTGVKVKFDARFIGGKWVIHRLSQELEDVVPDKVPCFPNIAGRVRRLLSETSGIIGFYLSDEYEEAHFLKSEVLKIPDMPLEFLLQKDTKVMMDVERQPDFHGVRFRAIRVWIENEETMSVSTTISSNLSQTGRDGNDIFSKVQDCLGYHEDYDLVVRSVLDNVLDDDEDNDGDYDCDGDRTIIDRRVLETLIDKVAMVPKRTTFIKKFEFQTRKLFSRMIAEFAN